MLAEQTLCSPIAVPPASACSMVWRKHGIRSGLTNVARSSFGCGIAIVARPALCQVALALLQWPRQAAGLRSTLTQSERAYLSARRASSQRGAMSAAELQLGVTAGQLGDGDGSASTVATRGGCGGRSTASCSASAGTHHRAFREADFRP